MHEILGFIWFVILRSHNPRFIEYRSFYKSCTQSTKYYLREVFHVPNQNIDNINLILISFGTRLTITPNLEKIKLLISKSVKFFEFSIPRKYQTMVQTCAKCSNSSKINKNVSFHNFPKDKAKRTVWLKALNLTSISNWSKVCSKHFSANDFRFSNDRNILQSTAVPTSNYKFLEEHSYADKHKVLTISSTRVRSLNSSMISEVYESSPSTSRRKSNENENFVETSQLSSLNLCSDVKVITPPRKIRRIWNSSRIGDLNDEHFSTPKKIRNNICLVKNTVAKIRQKNKILNQRNQRLKKKVSSLLIIINELKNKLLIFEHVAINLEIYNKNNVESINVKK